jgi:hypothetical protein
MLRIDYRRLLTPRSTELTVFPADEGILYERRELPVAERVIPLTTLLAFWVKSMIEEPVAEKDPMLTEFESP